MSEQQIPDLAGLVNDGPAAPTTAPTTALAAQMPANVWETTLDDQTIEARDFEEYKGRKGVTDRIALLDPKKIVISRTHYKEGIGFVLCNSEYRMQGSSEICTKVAPCCEHMEPPKKRIRTLIIQYNTDPQGKLLKPFGFRLLVWRFSDERFVQLRNINGEWPLAEHDLLVACEDEKYQKMAISVCRESAIRIPDVRALPAPDGKGTVGSAVEEWFGAVYPKLVKAAGRKLTNQELLQKLGKGGGPAVAAPQMDAPINEIADLLR